MGREGQRHAGRGRPEAGGTAPLPGRDGPGGDRRPGRGDRGRWRHRRPAAKEGDRGREARPALPRRPTMCRPSTDHRYWGGAHADRRSRGAGRPPPAGGDHQGLAATGTDRRGFLRRRASAPPGWRRSAPCRRGARRRSPAAAGSRRPRSPSPASRTSARIARSAAPSSPRSRTASGSARSRPGTARSTAARIAPRAPSVRELVHGDRRLKYPMKLVDGAVEPHLLGPGDQRDRRQAAGDPRQVRRRLRLSGSARPSSPTRAPICSASSPPSGAPTTPTTRRASATPPPSPASPTPGATAR